MNPSEEESPRPLTDTELDAALAAANEELLAYVRGAADPRSTLIAIMASEEAAGGGSPLLPRLEAVRRRMDTALVRATVSPDSVRRWEERTKRHGSRYMTVAPTRLLYEVLFDLEEIQCLCDQAQPPRLQLRLRRVAAQLAGLIGMLLINLGHHRLAGGFFQTAQMAADDTGELALRAWVMVRRALVSHYYGDPWEGLRLARAAMDLTDGQPCAARAMAPVTEARALARLARQGGPGAVADARRALARGRQVIDEVDNPEQADPAFGYTRRQTLFHLGEAMAELGLFSEAEYYLAQALALYAPEEQLDRTLIQFDRAFCRAALGDSEEASRLATQTIQELPLEYRTSIIRQRVRQLESVIRSQEGDVPIVRTFGDVLAQL